MVRKRKQPAHSDVDFSNVAAKITTNNLETEIETSFLPYTKTVILGRALPDARDGMKPVVRRVLWTMMKHGFVSSKPHIKSATVAGACIGEYHPHGDVAVYEAAARLTRPYIYNVTLIDGHGNFGSSPGENPANQRYTEMRLEKFSEKFLRETQDNAVDMIPNFSESLMEPVVLPVSLPLLLINGGSGVAVGFACNFAPHNPGEAIDAVIATIKKPNISVDELMKIIPGPDFPTGGEIIGVERIRNAYSYTQEDMDNGIDMDRRCKIRARYRINDLPRGKKQIEFYELPYDMPHQKVKVELWEIAREGKVEGITNVQNLGDRHKPTSVCVEVKSGIDAEKVAQKLFLVSKTLTITFAFNHNAIYNGRPMMMSLKNMITCFVQFRKDVIARRTQSQLTDKLHKKHVLEGFAACLLDIDSVIKIIRSSEGQQDACVKLMKKFKIDEEQATYVGSMRLFQLTKSDKLEIDKNIEGINKEIEDLERILSDTKVVEKMIIDELREHKKSADIPRRSIILDMTIEEATQKTKEVEELVSAPMEIDEQPCSIVLTQKGYLWKAVGEKAKITSNKTTGPIVSVYAGNTHGNYLVVTSLGNSYRVNGLIIPNSPEKSGDVVTLKTGESVVGVFPLPDDSNFIVGLCTRNGIVKSLDCSTLTKAEECIVIGLKDGDSVLSARPITDSSRYVFVTSDANVLAFDSNIVRPQGRAGGGIAGIKLSSGASVIYADSVDMNDENILLTNTDQSIKACPLQEYPVKGRATLGVRCHKLLKGEEKLIGAWCSPSPSIMCEKGTLSVPSLSKRDASGTKYDFSETGKLTFGK